MTDVDYEKLRESTDLILKNVEGFLTGIDVEKLTLLKKKLGLIKGIIGDIAKINECCDKDKGALNLLPMLMMMNTVKGDNKEDIQKKMLELLNIKLPREETDELYDETLGKEEKDK